MIQILLRDQGEIGFNESVAMSLLGGRPSAMQRYPLSGRIFDTTRTLAKTAEIIYD
ncbi:hypothetical protein N9189_02735 [Pirellulaceae bacterium]|nr:hypothetical protein [Pirellulaceae bacterium]